MQALLIVCSYAIICGCRFILGVGVGGQFPLSAAAAKDSAAAQESSEQRVGWAFFWQTPGSLAPYLVGLSLSQLPLQRKWAASLGFRLIFGLGAIPAMIVAWAELNSPKVRCPPFLLVCLLFQCSLVQCWSNTCFSHFCCPLCLDLLRLACTPA